MWSFHCKLLSMVIPRNFVWLSNSKAAARSSVLCWFSASWPSNDCSNKQPAKRKVLVIQFFRGKHYSGAAIVQKICLHRYWTQKPHWVMSEKLYAIGFFHLKAAKPNMHYEYWPLTTGHSFFLFFRPFWSQWRTTFSLTAQWDFLGPNTVQISLLIAAAK